MTQLYNSLTPEKNQAINEKSIFFIVQSEKYESITLKFVENYPDLKVTFQQQRWWHQLSENDPAIYSTVLEEKVDGCTCYKSGNKKPVRDCNKHYWLYSKEIYKAIKPQIETLPDYWYHGTFNLRLFTHEGRIKIIWRKLYEALTYQFSDWWYLRMFHRDNEGDGIHILFRTYCHNAEDKFIAICKKVRNKLREVLWLDAIEEYDWEQSWSDKDVSCGSRNYPLKVAQYILGINPDYIWTRAPWKGIKGTILSKSDTSP